MYDTGKISDKGKEKVTSQSQAPNFIKIATQEKLTLDPQRDIMGGKS